MEECSCRCSEWRHCVVVRRITPLLRRIGWVMFHRRRTAGAETRRVHRARGGGGAACSGPLLCLQWSSRPRVGRAVRGAWTVSADWLAISAQLISDNHAAAGRCHLATVPVASRLTYRAVCVINRRLSASRWSACVRVSAGRPAFSRRDSSHFINQSISHFVGLTRKQARHKDCSTTLKSTALKRKVNLMSIRQEGLILALRLYHVQLCATLKRFQTLALGPTTDIIVMTTIYITTRKKCAVVWTSWRAGPYVAVPAEIFVLALRPNEPRWVTSLFQRNTNN